MGKDLARLQPKGKKKKGGREEKLKNGQKVVGVSEPGLIGSQENNPTSGFWGRRTKN